MNAVWVAYPQAAMVRLVTRSPRASWRVPVILRPTHLEGAPFQQLQALPRDANPITRWANRDEAWADVVGGIRLAAESLRALNRPPP